MQIDIVQRLPAKPPVLVLGAYAGRQLTPFAARLDRKLGGMLARAMRGGRFTGQRDQHLDFVAPPEAAGARRLILVGLGPRQDLAPLTAQEIGGRIENALASRGEAEGAVALDLPGDLAAHLILGVRLAGQRFVKFRTRKRPEDPGSLRRLCVLAKAGGKLRRALDRASAVAAGVATARGLVNEPANLLGPEEFVRRARGLQRLGVKVAGAGGGESAPPRHGRLAGGGRRQRTPAPLAAFCDGRVRAPRPSEGRSPLSARASCFDAGGISIKKADGMEEMGTDMAGAAAVVGVMQALALRQAPVEAVGVAALVENMPSDTSYRPGDIVKSMSGDTIEIINTDAEGRLILLDALYYTTRRFKPRAIIDLATLTYAVGAALGRLQAGLFCNDEVLAKRLIAAGAATGERLWRLPLDEGYDKNLRVQCRRYPPDRPG